VFDDTATNGRIYGLLVRSLIRAAVDGFNGTAFAYGQTSSGKTFTMNGSSADPGIIPLAIRDIFDTAAEVFFFLLFFAELIVSFSPLFYFGSGTGCRP
jgi:centromeric protein E